MSAAETVSRHYAAHVAHQQAVWEQALGAEGFDAAIIHSGSQVYSFLDDYHYPFRPNPHFLAWLPLTRHDESVLVIRPGERPLLYYYQPDDYWYLPPGEPEAWWAQHFDVRPVRHPGDWRSGVPVGREVYIGDAPELANESDLNPNALLNRLHLERTRKTPYELDCLAASSRIAARGHQAAAQAFAENCSEYEIHLRYLAATQLTDAELPYSSIVALNRNGAVLHYQQRERQAPVAHRSFLIDAGATYHGYCSDITRTYTAESGLFAELVAGVEALQLDLCNAMRPGADYRDLHLRAHRDIARLLAELGLITTNPDTAVASGLSSVFFPHGIGHYLGLQTHDVAGLIADVAGTQIPRPKGHPYLRLTRKLEAGNVLTVEPGVYFIDTLLEKWRAGGQGMINWDRVEELREFGGVRIEDNVAVTGTEPINLSRTAFAAA